MRRPAAFQHFDRVAQIAERLGLLVGDAHPTGLRKPQLCMPVPKSPGGDGLLNAEDFADLREAKALGASRQNDYNHRRPHSSLAYRTPATIAASCGQANR